MIKNVEASYFIKLLFSYLEEKKKLVIMKYNERLKHMIDISLINYKYFSRKYLIHENGKVNEYNGYTDQLIFEGEYLNGIIWNAKFYDKDKIVCVIKNGKGKNRDAVINNGNILKNLMVKFKI